jgi:hypothetical protein
MEFPEVLVHFLFYHPSTMTAMHSVIAFASAGAKKLLRALLEASVDRYSWTKTRTASVLRLELLSALCMNSLTHLSTPRLLWRSRSASVSDFAGGSATAHWRSFFTAPAKRELCR